MKQGFLVMSLLLTLSAVQAQEVVEITQADKEQIADQLDREAEKPEHDRKTRRFLRKVGDAFRESAETVSVEFKKLDDCVNCGEFPKAKGEVLLTNIGRKLGRGASWLSTTTAKPFVQAAGWLTGLFERKDKNQDVVAIYKLFLENREEFDKLYLEAGTPNDMLNLMLGKMEEIVDRKSNLAVRDYLVHLGIKREIPEDLKDFELTDEEVASIDPKKLDPDFINKHPAYAPLRPIVGDVTKSDLEDIMLAGYFDKSVSFENYKKALPRIHEGVLAVGTQVMGPKIALGVVSNTLAGLYAVPVVAANVGSLVSVGVCTSKKTIAKFEKDDDLRSFCSYVTNKSSYEFVKSRAKGYIGGKNTRAKIDAKLKGNKEKREQRKKEEQKPKDEGELLPQTSNELA